MPERWRTKLEDSTPRRVVEHVNIEWRQEKGTALPVLTSNQDDPSAPWKTGEIPYTMVGEALSFSVTVTRGTVEAVPETVNLTVSRPPAIARENVRVKNWKEVANPGDSIKFNASMALSADGEHRICRWEVWVKGERTGLSGEVAQQPRLTHTVPDEPGGEVEIRLIVNDDANHDAQTWKYRVAKAVPAASRPTDSPETRPVYTERTVPIPIECKAPSDLLSIWQIQRGIGVLKLYPSLEKASALPNWKARVQLPGVEPGMVNRLASIGVSKIPSTGRGFVIGYLDVATSRVLATIPIDKDAPGLRVTFVDEQSDARAFLSAARLELYADAELVAEFRFFGPGDLVGAKAAADADVADAKKRLDVAKEALKMSVADVERANVEATRARNEPRPSDPEKAKRAAAEVEALEAAAQKMRDVHDQKDKAVILAAKEFNDAVSRQKRVSESSKPTASDADGRSAAGARGDGGKATVPGGAPP